jgi:hypothetical protein
MKKNKRKLVKSHFTTVKALKRYLQNLKKFEEESRKTCIMVGHSVD